MGTGSRKFDISETENAVIHFKLKNISKENAK